MFDNIWFAALLVFAATSFGTLSLAMLWEVFRDWFRNRQVGKRLQPLMETVAQAQARALDLIREDPLSRRGVFGGSGTTLPGLRQVEDLLDQANLRWRPETFIFMTFGLTLAAGGAVLVVTGSIFFGWLAAMAGAGSPYFYARRRRARRFLDFEEQFPEAIDLLTRAIRAGHPLSAGMRMVGDEGPPAVAEEFRRTFEEQRFGLPFEDALLGFVDRMDTVDVRIFAIAVLVQREVGGNLAEILDNLAKTIRGRFYIRRQLRVYTAQGRLSGYVLVCLPIGVGFILWLIEASYVGLLFTTLVGWAMVFVALVLWLVGFFWIRSIINIEI